LCDVEEIVSILDVSNDNIYVSSSGSDCEMFDAGSSESESGTSDNGSETLVTHVSSNWLQVTDCDPGPNTSISVKNIERKAVLIGQLSLFNIFIFSLIWIFWNLSYRKQH
jgi:hypothetical protein